MKPIFDAQAEERRAAIRLMQFGEQPSVSSSQSDLPPVPQFESTLIFRSTVVVVILVALASILASAPDQPQSAARALHQRVTV
ncbi:hypothetical protein [Burkholderia gladioli]|uniref:hypothetical protein n=1 Tax=Burkholderia gladioli TaxID=28095 RepID=UPI0016414646|nr:hypothetical protein [Burkholderia gladioli]